MTKKFFFFHTTNCRNLWFNILKWFKKQQQGTLKKPIKKNWLIRLTDIFFFLQQNHNERHAIMSRITMTFIFNMWRLRLVCFTFFQSFFFSFLTILCYLSLVFWWWLFFSPWNLAYLDFLYIWHFWPRSKDLAMRTNGSLLIYRERQIDMKWV